MKYVKIEAESGVVTVARPHLPWLPYKATGPSDIVQSPLEYNGEDDAIYVRLV